MSIRTIIEFTFYLVFATVLGYGMELVGLVDNGKLSYVHIVAIMALILSVRNKNGSS